jgi:curved DNA binding protein
MSDDSSTSSAESVVEEIKEEENTDLSNSDVCTKYQEASKIVNLALKGLIEQCVPGAKVLDLCKFGATIIDTSASKLYQKKVNGVAIEKGVAFPVCVSVNDVICNHSPLGSEEVEPLKAGDIVKLDLGCHIDGYISVAAHTLIVPEAAGSAPEVDDEIGNVAVAAYNAMLVAAASIKAGTKNAAVTEAVDRVANSYGVNAISSVRMHQMKRFVIDGVKEVALKEPTADELEAGEEKVDECTFEQAEVYAVDVAMSTGEGKPRPSGVLRTTVFKRNVEANYRLKMKNARYLLSEVDKKFPTLPFTLAHFDDERAAKMGVTECVSHGLLTPYPVLHEQKDAKVAHFKCTVLLLPSGTSRVTGLEMPDYFKTDKKPDEETEKLLAELAEIAAKKAKKKAAKKKKNKKKN